MHQVGYKRQADRGKRAAEQEMGLIFPPAYIHGTIIRFFLVRVEIFERIVRTFAAIGIIVYSS